MSEWRRLILAVVYVWMIDLSIRYGDDHQGLNSNTMKCEALPRLRKALGELYRQ